MSIKKARHGAREGALMGGMVALFFGVIGATIGAGWALAYLFCEIFAWAGWGMIPTAVVWLILVFATAGFLHGLDS
jgi:hypothetical protein